MLEDEDRLGHCRRHRVEHAGEQRAEHTTTQGAPLGAQGAVGLLGVVLDDLVEDGARLPDVALEPGEEGLEGRGDRGELGAGRTSEAVEGGGDVGVDVVAKAVEHRTGVGEAVGGYGVSEGVLDPLDQARDPCVDVGVAGPLDLVAQTTVRLDEGLLHRGDDLVGLGARHELRQAAHELRLDGGARHRLGLVVRQRAGDPAHHLALLVGRCRTGDADLRADVPPLRVEEGAGLLVTTGGVCPAGGDPRGGCPPRRARVAARRTRRSGRAPSRGRRTRRRPTGRSPAAVPRRTCGAGWRPAGGSRGRRR